jgi:hypothetical protein
MESYNINIYVDNYNLGHITVDYLNKLKKQFSIKTTIDCIISKIVFRDIRYYINTEKKNISTLEKHIKRDLSKLLPAKKIHTVAITNDILDINGCATTRQLYTYSNLNLNDLRIMNQLLMKNYSNEISIGEFSCYFSKREAKDICIYIENLFYESKVKKEFLIDHGLMLNDSKENIYENNYSI